MGDIEIAINPATGRITELQKNGVNLLWVNPDPQINDPWPNWGGIKTWIWPQSSWPKLWPPLGEMDGAAWDSSGEGEGRIVLRSPSISYFKAQLSQECTLSSGSLKIASTVHQIELAEHEISPWLVMQLPIPRQVLIDSKGVTLTPGDEGKQFFTPDEAVIVTADGSSLTVRSENTEDYSKHLQIYLDIEGRYIEIEFAGLPKRLQPGESYSLTTELTF